MRRISAIGIAKPFRVSLLRVRSSTRGGSPQDGCACVKPHNANQTVTPIPHARIFLPPPLLAGLLFESRTNIQPIVSRLPHCARFMACTLEFLLFGDLDFQPFEVAAPRHIVWRQGCEPSGNLVGLAELFEGVRMRPLAREHDRHLIITDF